MRLNLCFVVVFPYRIFFRLLTCDKVAFLYLYKNFRDIFFILFGCCCRCCCWWYIVQEHVIIFLFYIMKREHRFYHTFLILEWHNVHTQKIVRTRENREWVREKRGKLKHNFFIARIVTFHLLLLTQITDKQTRSRHPKCKIYIKIDLEKKSFLEKEKEMK